jgi:hypothetical protein
VKAGGFPPAFVFDTLQWCGETTEFTLTQGKTSSLITLTDVKFHVKGNSSHWANKSIFPYRDIGILSIS